MTKSVEEIEPAEASGTQQENGEEIISVGLNNNSSWRVNAFEGGVNEEEQ